MARRTASLAVRRAGGVRVPGLTRSRLPARIQVGILPPSRVAMRRLGL
jgi:hypothetical protein